MGKETIDGVEYEIGTDSWKQARSRADAAKDQRIADLQKEADTKQAKIDSLEKDLSEAKQREDSIEDRIAATVAFRADASAVLGDDYSFSGKSDRDVMTEALQKTDSAFNAEGKSDDYVRARFDLAVEKAKQGEKRNDGGSFRKAADQATKLDASDDIVEKARLANIERSRNAWTQPLRVSVDATK